MNKTQVPDLTPCTGPGPFYMFKLIQSVQGPPFTMLPILLESRAVGVHIPKLTVQRRLQENNE